MRVVLGSSQQRASWDVWGASWDVWGALGERYVLGGDVRRGRCDDDDDRSGHHVGPLGAKWLKTVVFYCHA